MPICFLINIVVVVNFYNFYLNYEYKYLFIYFFDNARWLNKHLLKLENNNTDTVHSLFGLQEVKR